MACCQFASSGWHRQYNFVLKLFLANNFCHCSCQPIRSHVRNGCPLIMMSKGNHINNASTWPLPELIHIHSFLFYLRRFCGPVISTVGCVYACWTVSLYCNWLLLALKIGKWPQVLWCLCFFWDPSLKMALVLDHEKNSNKNDLDTFLQPSSLSLSIN